MTRIGASLGIAIWIVAAGTAHAQDTITLWNCKDKDGRTVLTSQKSDTVGRECRVVSQERVSTIPSPKSAPSKSSPANFPRESAADRQSARSKQRATLEGELAQEESMLADARKKLTEQEGIRTGDEKNYSRVLDRLKPFQDTVEVHQKNVEALKREITNLSR